MKIAYILEVNPYQNSGIIKKVNDQVDNWQRNGHQVSLFSPWPKPRSTSKNYINAIFLSSKFLVLFPDGFIKNFLNKIFCSSKLKHQLKVIGPDVLYIRQNTWYPGLTNILRQHKTILELNTVDTIEIKYYPKLKRTIYLFGRERILANAKGLVAVSPDILKYYQHYRHLKTAVVSNGINLERIRKIKKNEKSELINLVFVGIKSTEWHGLEKVITLANALPEYFFNIVGPDKSEGEKYPSNVKFHGWVDKKQLEEIYSHNHFGLGSFSNYLVGKETDSTLKVREYLAYGLPVILGHWDVDFNNVDFVFKATDENHKIIDYTLIRDYIEKNKNKVVENINLKIIDSNTKEQERLTFFNEIKTL